MFQIDDEPPFIQNVEALIGDGAAAARGLSGSEYATICRLAWMSCATDVVFHAKLLLDDRVKANVDPPCAATKPSEPVGVADGPYCVLIARADLSGRLIDAPDGYSIPEDGARRAVIRVSGSGISEKEPDTPNIVSHLVAIFDVLGFEAKMRELGLPRIFDLYKELIAEAVLGPNRESPWLRGFDSSDQEEAGDFLHFFPGRFAYFSDTILFWVPYHHPMVLEPFLLRCAAMFCAALRVGLPLRGAIAVGDAVLHAGTNTFLGSPIIEAARLEQAQDWVGVSLGSSFRELDALLPGLGTIAIYDAPRKPGRDDLFSGLVLDWPSVWLAKYGPTARDQLEALSAPAVSRYYDNAIAFVSESDAARARQAKDLAAQGLVRVAGFKP